MEKKTLAIVAPALGAMLCAPAFAQNSYIPLNYNWNGLAHPSEVRTEVLLDNTADLYWGYRSMSDRGLTIGYDSNSIGAGSYTHTGDSGLDYHFHELAGVNRDQPGLDIILLGQRTNWDTFENNDDQGVYPNWLIGNGVYPSVTSTFDAISLESSATIGVLYYAANGGGTFDMTLGFSDGSSATVELHAPDWWANANHRPSAAGAGVASQAVLNAPLSGGDGFGSVERRDYALLSGGPLNVIEATVNTESLLSGIGFDMTNLELTSLTVSNYSGSSAASVLAASVLVPEPASLAVLGLGCITMMRRRRSA